MEPLSASDVRQLVPGFPAKRFDANEQGEPVEYQLGEVELSRAVIQSAFSLPDRANDIYQRLSASAQEWERAEPRGILTPSWEEIEQQVAEGACPPLVVRAQADGTFLLLDGHHRASMARHLGIERMGAFVDWNGIERRPQLTPLNEAPETEPPGESVGEPGLTR